MLYDISIYIYTHESHEFRAKRVVVEIRVLFEVHQILRHPFERTLTKTLIWKTTSTLNR